MMLDLCFAGPPASVHFCHAHPLTITCCSLTSLLFFPFMSFVSFHGIHPPSVLRKPDVACRFVPRVMSCACWVQIVFLTPKKKKVLDVILMNMHETNGLIQAKLIELSCSEELLPHLDDYTQVKHYLQHWHVSSPPLLKCASLLCAPMTQTLPLRCTKRSQIGQLRCHVSLLPLLPSHSWVQRVPRLNLPFDPTSTTPPFPSPSLPLPCVSPQSAPF